MYQDISFAFISSVGSYYFQKGNTDTICISDVFFIYGFDKQCYKHFVVQTVLLFFFSSFCYLNAQKFMFLGMLKESDGNR